MAEPFGSQAASTPQAVTAAQIDHLPIVAHFARRLELAETVNRLVATRMAVEPGLIVLGLVLDTLSGRSPLYHLQTAFEDCDRAVLFGEELPAEYFSDDNVGRMLDRLYETGTQRIFSALSVAALERFPISTEHVHFDTTSVSLYGDYPNAEDEEAAFKITHGYEPRTSARTSSSLCSRCCASMAMSPSSGGSRTATLRIRRSTTAS